MYIYIYNLIYNILFVICNLVLLTHIYNYTIQFIIAFGIGKKSNETICKRQELGLKQNRNIINMF